MVAAHFTFSQPVQTEWVELLNAVSVTSGEGTEFG